MTGLIIFIVAMVAVAGALGFVWRHRTGKLAPGIGAAGAAYNEFNGQGALPTILAPDTGHRTPDTGHRTPDTGHRSGGPAVG
ncbi:MAG: hypothetical protein ABIR83_14215 [Nakamurella sp.]